VRIGNLRGRLVLVTADGAIDVAQASDGKFGPDPQAVYAQWDDFCGWAATFPSGNTVPFDPEDLEAPVPRPAQVFAIGLNYDEHADESGYASPTTSPPVFTKFPSCITGPHAEVTLPDGNVDWEVELVAVIGRSAWQVPADDALGYVAGLTVGQDLSERVLQFAATPPQFSLGKSFPGFGPTGPVVVTLDEFKDPNDLALTCTINGAVVQSGRTSQMIFTISALIAELSSSTRLCPGDLVFTGTPSGVGVGMSPPRFLSSGDEVVSTVEGIGSLRNRLKAAPAAARSQTARARL
jgi:2,4-diketo-3-deoxy-L-fuconate hydrolase